VAWDFAPDPVDGALVRYVEDVAWDAARMSTAEVVVLRHRAESGQVD
jgi:hypothetical protein